jgi:phosphoribosylaminoimidazolecarboxamide formyltransferase/IMP cyclohydrolase
MPRPCFAILGSGRGTNADRLMEAFAATVLDKAAQHGFPAVVIDGPKETHEARLLAALASAGVGYLLLAGYLRILSSGFLERFGGRILNVHPSLLPAFPGLDAPARQWEAGVQTAGATVHFVDAGVDTGPILLQGRIAVRGDEGPDGLAHRILTEVEHRIYPRALRLFVDQLMAEAEGRASPGVVRRALVSVHDKTGAADLARRLVAAGVTVLASGGTAAALRAAGVSVTTVESVTAAPELLGGRVKTLHPAIHAGLLADRRHPDHLAELAAAGFEPIDLVVCNLYPFERTITEGADRDEVVENIDIGGPTLLRAAAKNADGGVTVVADPGDYERVLGHVEATGSIPQAVRRDLAAAVFALVADYDAVIASWLGGAVGPDLGHYDEARPLRYGENPHQTASLYVGAERRGVAAGVLLHGKELSYNNLADLDAAYRSAYGAGPHRCSVVKHTNPCGLAEAATQEAAFIRALSGDPVAAFGSVLGFNQPVAGDTARSIIDSGLFVECIAAPGFTDSAIGLLAARKNLRLLQVPPGDPAPATMVTTVGGGLLVQEPDPGPADPGSWRTVTRRAVDAEVLAEMAFGMRAVAHLKSNAVCVTSERTLRGAGAGLMSRVDACRIALDKAGDHTRGAILASDGFFPFDDSVRLAAAAGIVAVVQPGGSRRDQEVVDACDELGMAMVFTGRRHFRHS